MGLEQFFSKIDELKHQNKVLININTVQSEELFKLKTRLNKFEESKAEEEGNSTEII